jgi:hypothetical protein
MEVESIGNGALRIYRGEESSKFKRVCGSTTSQNIASRVASELASEIVSI